MGANKLGWPSMSALVVGGMVGGGIYVALGVVVEAAGQWAWLSFVVAGAIAVATAYSYACLSNHFQAGGGAFQFLEKMDRTRAAGSLSWVLLGAYTLTIALYAFAFGQYVSHAFGASQTVIRILSVAIVAILMGLNLWGVGKLTSVEITIVSANLCVLLVVGVAGFTEWSPSGLSVDSDPKSAWSAAMGAAAIFVSYEGFQLLTYEYEHLKKPKATLQPVLVISAVVVIAIYVVVAVGATMILGASQAIHNKTVALSLAAEQIFGTAGLIVMTVAAAFATSAAINSTLFSTAKLAKRVADDGELPAWLDHENSRDIPDRAVIAIATLATVLAVIGSLSGLVEAASLAFLAAFGAVNVIAWRERAGKRWVPAAGLGIGAVVGAVLLYRLATTKPIPLAVMCAFFVLCFVGRPWLLRHVDAES